MQSLKKEIKISVRNLVEFILRSGDIDNRRITFGDKEAMQAGSRMHRKIQSRQKSGYKAEVPLKISVEDTDFLLTIEGRADGIIEEESCVTIDEIKGVYRDLAFLEEPVFVHKAQAMCYAYIFSNENHLKSIQIQMTYCNLDTEEVKYFTEEYSFTELQEWFDALIKKYLIWARFEYEWSLIRTEAIQELEFPFMYREGQKNLVASVYRTILRNKNIFIQAPTGVGKTMSTVFPSVKAIGEGLGEKIFYLTAKTITKTVAEEAFRILQAQGLRMKVLTITAKEKLCVCENMECNPENCLYAKGHFERVNDAVYDLLQEQDEISRAVLINCAKKHEVCPFEFCLDVATWVDVVICDYNYVFDPNVALKRFFGEGIKGDYLFLIDESHNLVDRGREMFSATLYKEDFLELKKKVKYYSRRLEKRLDHANRKLLELKRECETYALYERVSEFVLTLLGLTAEIEKFLEDFHDAEVDRQVLEFYFNVRHFLNMNERVDENYVIYGELDENGKFKVKLYCINPAKNLSESLQKGRTTIYFSATLLPIYYYKELLSMNTEDYAIYAESPFQEKNRELLIATDVTSKYTRRSPAEYQRIADYMKECIGQRPGNYMAFFPSYQFMQKVYEFVEGQENIRCLLQEPHMMEEEREEFLEEFQINDNPKQSLLGMCVLGGIFGEGIDLKKDRLIGAFIVGTGLPLVCNEREILKKYYDKKGMNGFSYAYQYPGMNKVLQAAGRVIRTQEDKGIIVLLEERFLQYDYQKLFPREWNCYTACNKETMGGECSSFWKENGE